MSPTRSPAAAASSSTAPGEARKVSSAKLIWAEFYYQQLSYWRNPISAFFTFFMPVLFLIIFATLYRGQHLADSGGLSLNQYFIPSIMTFGVIAACYTSLAINLTTQREVGILKRVRGTPMPPWGYLVATIAGCVVRALLLVAITLGVGTAFYGLVVPAHAALALPVTVVVGSAAFCALGIAVTTFVPNADAAPAVVNAIYLPLMFLSGTFFQVSSGSVLGKIAAYFPVRPFVLLAFSSLDPRVSGSGLDAADLVKLAIWGGVGVVVSLRRFRWVPKRTG